MDIKPIETVFMGYRFRSRLEARWAVFFQTLGVVWEYEKEGFELGDGLRYLPDFFLPRHDLWVEIKSSNHALTDPDGWQEDIRKFSRFCRQPGEPLCQRSAALVQGDPWPGDFAISVAMKGWDRMDVMHGVWAIDRWDDGSLWISGDDGAVQLNPASTAHGRWPLTNHVLLDRAYQAARSARFEFGETPRA